MSKRQTEPPEVLPEQERWWYTSAEVAEAWTVSERTLYRWLADGRFTPGRDYFRSTPQGTGPYLWTEQALPAEGER